MGKRRARNALAEERQPVSVWASITKRAQLLHDLRWAEDCSVGDPDQARRDMDANSGELGLGRFPRWLIVVLDGAIRGLYTYQWTSRLKLGNFSWIIWRLLAAISAVSAVMTWGLDRPNYLVGVIIGPWIAVTCASTGIVYDSSRALLGKTTFAKLASGSLAGLAAYGPTLLLLTSNDGRVSSTGLGILCCFCLAVGAIYEWMWLGGTDQLPRRRG